MFKTALPRTCLAVVLLASVTNFTMARQTPAVSGNTAAEKKVREQLAAVQASLVASDIKTALERADMAAAEAEKSLPESHPLRIEAAMRVKELRGGRAILSRDMPTAKAESEAEVALGRKLPAGHSARVRSLLNAAELLLALGNPKAALDRYEEAAQQLSASKSKQNGGELILCWMMAAFLRGELENRDQAAIETLAAKVRAVTKSKPNDATLRPVATKIWTYLLGRANAASTPDRKASEAVGERLRTDLDRVEKLLVQAGVSPSLAGWGRLYLLKFQYDHGRFSEAQTTLDRLKSVAEASDLKADITAEFRAEYWSYQGLLKTEQGDYVTAREAHEKELRIRLDEKVPGRQRSLNSLGQLLVRLGDYRAAQEALEDAVAMYATDPYLKNDPIRPLAITQLARAIEGSGNLSEAARLHREALALAESGPRPDLSAVCVCRNNLGVNRYTAGDLETARDSFEKTRTDAVKHYGENHLHVAELDINLGWVAKAKGKTEEAESRFRSALRVIESVYPDSHRHAEVLGYLASVLTALGKTEEARTRLDRAIVLRETTLDRSLRSAFSDRERLAIVQELRFHSESRSWPGVLDTYFDLAPILKIPDEEQYARLLVWKGAIARGDLASPGLLENDPQVRLLAEKREQLLKSLRAAANETPSPADRAAHNTKIGDFEAQINDLERQLRRVSRKFATLSGSAVTSPRSVIAAVPDGWAFLDVIEIRRPGEVKARRPMREERRYVAFLVRKDRKLARLDLGDAEPIDTAIREFLRLIDAPTEDFKGPAGRLATLFRAPLREALTNAKGFILSGDGMLQRLPMAALPGSKPDTFWIEDLALATVPSAQSLVARASQQPRATGALIVGDVDYASLAGFDELPQTRGEAESVVNLFRTAYPSEAVRHLTRAAANEPAVRSDIQTHRIVHLATHGYFNASTKAGSSSETFGALAQLDSGFILARAKGQRSIDSNDDQRFSAEELRRLDLRGVELMVLSACSSGLGHISAGQGVVGLIGAVDRAGVRTVVCSLWKVNDEATAALMKSFYGHLWTDKPRPGPAQALRAAQLDLIRGPSGGQKPPPFANPHFWAAFFVSGSP